MNKTRGCSPFLPSAWRTSTKFTPMVRSALVVKREKEKKKVEAQKAAALKTKPAKAPRKPARKDRKEAAA